jgi:flagellar protein FlbT
MTEFMDAIRERKALGTCVEISRDVMSGAYYKALVKCRTLSI